MNTEQAIAYGTEEWWEYLRGNIDTDTLVQRLDDMGLRTTRWLAQNARARNEGLPVYYDGDKDTLLPQPY
jgi:hypothetical protein